MYIYTHIYILYLQKGAPARKTVTKQKKSVKKAPGVQKQGSKLFKVVKKVTEVVKVICNTCQKRQVFVYKGDNYKHCKQCLCMGKMKSDPRKPCIYPKKFRKFCQNCHDGN